MHKKIYCVGAPLLYTTSNLLNIILSFSLRLNKALYKATKLFLVLVFVGDFIETRFLKLLLKFAEIY